jgi:hypothetical protein
MFAFTGILAVADIPSVPCVTNFVGNPSVPNLQNVRLHNSKGRLKRERLDNSAVELGTDFTPKGLNFEIALLPLLFP